MQRQTEQGQPGQAMGNPLQQQMQVGKNPPAMLTGKDVGYLEDTVSWLLNAVKKFDQYASATQDAEVKRVISAAAGRHRRQIQTLLQCLEPQTGSTSGFVSTPQTQAGLH